MVSHNITIVALLMCILSAKSGFGFGFGFGFGCYRRPTTQAKRDHSSVRTAAPCKLQQPLYYNYIPCSYFWVAVAYINPTAENKNRDKRRRQQHYGKLLPLTGLSDNQGRTGRAAV
jgi:hypothetical protein